MAKNPTVLVVDDSATARALTRHMLIFEGLDVVEAMDGKSALDQLDASADFLAIFVDMNMPRMNGVQFIEAAREKIDFDKVAVFMLTVMADPKLVETVKRLGLRGFFTKPLTQAHLQKALLSLGHSLSPRS